MQRLRDATAFVAPALRGESFGVVLLEAMAASTPVIASDIAGYRNVATNGVDAVLVQPGDSHDMADAIQRLMADNELRMKLINGGLQRASSMSMERLASLYVDRYRQVLNSQT
jgi:phosphatidylinositol alpha-mannosyltransferase